MTTAPVLLANEVHSPGQERAVVLLHSLGLDRRVWQDIVGPLSERMTVVTLDLRGHGESPHGDGFTVEDMADDVARTLSELGFDQVAMVGMSMGGCVAQAFAVRYPDRVTALGLIDSTAWYGPDAAEVWAQRAEKAQQDGMRSLSEFQLSRWFSDEFLASNSAIGAELLDVFAANDLTSYLASCRVMGSVDLREGLASVQVPTVVIVGELDAATPPSHAEDLYRRIKGSEIHVVAGSKHLTAVERPDEVVSYLKTVLV